MRKKYSSKLKAQIVLEMIKEEKTVAQLASEHGIHPTVLHRWRRQALENLPQVFANEENVEAVKAEYEKKIEELYTEIGRLTTKLAWLEKKGLRVE
jgi:transposase